VSQPPPAGRQLKPPDWAVLSGADQVRPWSTMFTATSLPSLEPTNKLSPDTIPPDQPIGRKPSMQPKPTMLTMHNMASRSNNFPVSNLLIFISLSPNDKSNYLWYRVITACVKGVAASQPFCSHKHAFQQTKFGNSFKGVVRTGGNVATGGWCHPRYSRLI